MRAERLNRRSHLRRGAVKPEGEITLYDLTGAAAPQGETAKLADMGFPEAMSHEMIAALPFSFETTADVMIWAAAILGESPTGRALWREAVGQGWSAGLADLRTGGFHIDVPRKEILLDHFALTAQALGRSAYFRNTMLMSLVRALRDVWQEFRFGPAETRHHPEDVLTIERVRAADADTLSVLVGWELRAAGHSDVWRHLIGSSEGDMAQVFTRFLERDPSALFSGAALAYAFRQWYADESRVDAVDHETLETLDDLLLASESKRPFGREEIDAEMIEDISTLPDDICYLAGMGAAILRDPFFAGLHDPINQTHLFHIMYDMEVVMVNEVPFRDPYLARRIFPQGEILEPEPAAPLESEG